MLTPNDLEVLLHCHTIPAVHPRVDASGVQKTINRFLDKGIIAPKEEYYCTTEKGAAWVKIILQVPCPIQVWVDRDNNII